jgi:hypothetical protein
MTYEAPKIIESDASTAIIAGRRKISSCTEASGSTAFSTSSYEVDE